MAATTASIALATSTAPIAPTSASDNPQLAAAAKRTTEAFQKAISNPNHNCLKEMALNKYLTTFQTVFRTTLSTANSFSQAVTQLKELTDQCTQNISSLSLSEGEKQTVSQKVLECIDWLSELAQKQLAQDLQKNTPLPTIQANLEDQLKIIDGIHPNGRQKILDRLADAPCFKALLEEYKKNQFPLYIARKIQENLQSQEQQRKSLEDAITKKTTQKTSTDSSILKLQGTILTTEQTISTNTSTIFKLKAQPKQPPTQTAISFMENSQLLLQKQLNSNQRQLLTQQNLSQALEADIAAKKTQLDQLNKTSAGLITEHLNTLNLSTTFIQYINTEESLPTIATDQQINFAILKLPELDNLTIALRLAEQACEETDSTRAQNTASEALNKLRLTALTDPAPQDIRDLTTTALQDAKDALQNVEKSLTPETLNTNLASAKTTINLAIQRTHQLVNAPQIAAAVPPTKPWWQWW